VRRARGTIGGNWGFSGGDLNNEGGWRGNVVRENDQIGNFAANWPFWHPCSLFWWRIEGKGLDSGRNFQHPKMRVWGVPDPSGIITGIGVEESCTLGVIYCSQRIKVQLDFRGGGARVFALGTRSSVSERRRFTNPGKG